MITEITFGQQPHGAVTKYRAHWRTATLADIEQEIAFAKNWQPYGYTNVLFCRATASIYITRAEIASNETVGALKGGVK
jgi:hypothetical protein